MTSTAEVSKSGRESVSERPAGGGSEEASGVMLPRERSSTLAVDTSQNRI